MKVYRQHLREVLEKTDNVVELGAHVGKSSEIILYKLTTGRLISIDNSPEAIEPMEKLSRYNDNFTFLNADVRLHETLEKVTKSIDRCDVLSIDLGGGYHPDTVFKVYYIWSSTLKPRDVLIRNQGLIDFVNSVDYDEEFESSEGWLEFVKTNLAKSQIKKFIAKKNAELLRGDKIAKGKQSCLSSSVLKITSHFEMIQYWIYQLQK